MSTYFAIILKDPDSAYGVVFPGVPGCFSAGDTFDEAARNAVDALQLHSDALADDGRALPEPMLLDAVLSHADAQDTDRVVIAVRGPTLAGSRVRLDVEVEPSLLDALDEAADRKGLTRADFLAEVVREKVAG